MFDALGKIPDKSGYADYFYFFKHTLEIRKREDEKGTYEYKKRRETDKAYWPEIW